MNKLIIKFHKHFNLNTHMKYIIKSQPTTCDASGVVKLNFKTFLKKLLAYNDSHYNYCPGFDFQLSNMFFTQTAR